MTSGSANVCSSYDILALFTPVSALGWRAYSMGGFHATRLAVMLPKARRSFCCFALLLSFKRISEAELVFSKAICYCDVFIVLVGLRFCSWKGLRFGFDVFSLQQGPP